MTAAIATIATSVKSIVATMRDHLRDGIEYTTGSRLCDRCMEVYDGAHCCPHAVIGECGDCGTQELTRAGCCPICGAARVDARRLRHRPGQVCERCGK